MFSRYFKYIPNINPDWRKFIKKEPIQKVFKEQIVSSSQSIGIQPMTAWVTAWVTAS